MRQKCRKIKKFLTWSTSVLDQEVAKSGSEYQRLKASVRAGAKLKSGILKYHPVFAAQRKMQKELQKKGYNDIFILNLMELSPQYAEYKKYLDLINSRICRDLGMYYDAEYNIVIRRESKEA